MKTRNALSTKPVPEFQTKMANQGEQLIKYHTFEAQTKPSYFGSWWKLVRKISNLYVLFLEPV